MDDAGRWVYNGIYINIYTTRIYIYVHIYDIIVDWDISGNTGYPIFEQTASDFPE